MSLIKRLLPNKNKDTDRAAHSNGERQLKKPSDLTPKKVTLEKLKEFIPIRVFSEDQLTAFALEKETEVFGADSVLFYEGEEIGSILYLIEGTVYLESKTENGYEVGGGTPVSRFPLSTGKLHNATAVTKTDAHVLRVSNKILESQEKSAASGNVVKDLNELPIPEQLAQSKLFEAFCMHYREEDLVLPAMADIATKLRRAIAQQDIGISEAANIVELDPVVATRLIRVANCPLYIAANPAKNCQEAVNRLGLIATRNLVTSVCLKEIFRSKEKSIKARLRAMWQQSVQIASLAYVLATENQFFDPEEALLAGLICDIGVIPFLHFVENLPRDYYTPEEIELAIPVIRGPVGSMLLSKWGFSKEFVDIPALSDNWYYDSGDGLDLADIIILSKLHYLIRIKKTTELPPITSIPACGKLVDGSLSPEYSLNILHNAKQRVSQAYGMLDS